MHPIAIIIPFVMLAQDPAAPKQEESPAIAILKAADEATAKVISIRYQGHFEGTGAQAGRQPVAHGTVTKGWASESDETMRIIGSGWFFVPTGAQGARTTPYKAMFDGRIIRRLDPEKKVVYEGSDASVLGPVFRLDMFEYGHDTPFRDELSGTVQIHEGRTLVGGIVCDVVYVEYGIEGAMPARWYFGAEDHLPRKVERLAPVDGRAGALVLTLTNLEVNFEVTEKDFELTVPEGYTKASSRSGGPIPTAEPRPIGRQS